MRRAIFDALVRPPMIVLSNPVGDGSLSFGEVAIFVNPDFLFLQGAMEPLDVAVSLWMMIRRGWRTLPRFWEAELDLQPLHCHSRNSSRLRVWRTCVVLRIARCVLPRTLNCNLTPSTNPNQLHSLCSSGILPFDMSHRRQRHARIGRGSPERPGHPPFWNLSQPARALPESGIFTVRLAPGKLGEAMVAIGILASEYAASSNSQVMKTNGAVESSVMPRLIFFPEVRRMQEWECLD